MKSSLYRIGAICAFLSVVTTIGIHSFIKGPATFEEGLLVYKTANYILSKYWVIFHCIFVIISIYSLAHYLSEDKKPIANLGLIFYVAFGLLEIVRMGVVLHYLSQLRDQYINTSDEALKQVIRLSIDGVSGIGNALFVAFTIAIILGNLFIGWACIYYNHSTRYLGIAFLVWTGFLTLSLSNEYLNVSWISQLTGYVSIIFQPLIRGFLGIVLIGFARQQRTQESIH